jgi:hypothetical protein
MEPNWRQEKQTNFLGLRQLKNYYFRRNGFSENSKIQTDTSNGQNNTTSIEIPNMPTKLLTDI